MEQTFRVLREHNLKLNASKCHFAQPSVQYLGHIISKDHVRTAPCNTEKVSTSPVPKTVKNIQSFLGMCNYYKKFIENYSQIASPMYKLLQKDIPFEWTKDCQEAFDKLKHCLATDPMLSMPSFDRQFILYTAASDVSISYVLAQKDSEGKERTICYGGRVIHKDELKWPTYEKEALAIVKGVEY